MGGDAGIQRDNRHPCKTSQRTGHTAPSSKYFALGKPRHVLRIGIAHGVDDPWFVDRLGVRLWAPPGIEYSEGLTVHEVLIPGACPIEGAQVFAFENAKKPEVAFSTRSRRRRVGHLRQLSELDPLRRLFLPGSPNDAGDGFRAHADWRALGAPDGPRGAKGLRPAA